MIKKYGCIGAIVVVAVLAIGGALVSWVAWRQIGSEAPRQERAERSPLGREGASPSGRVTLDVEIANLIVIPAPPGEPIRVEADYDPSRYRLEESLQPDSGAGFDYRLRFEPLNSKWMALLRMKLGGVPPRIRLALPSDVHIQLDGRVRRAFGTFELGGMSVETLKLRVDGGAAVVSVLQPTAMPLESFDAFCDKGSLKISGLGNADPKEVEIDQHLGELDLDLRGSWRRDADVHIGAYLAAGRVWLPENMDIRGSDVPGIPSRVRSDVVELRTPVMNLELIQKGGRLIFIDARARRD